MTLKDIESLLNIARLAHGWPELKGLENAALKELREAELNTLISIQPVSIVGTVKLEKEEENETRQSYPRRA